MRITIQDVIAAEGPRLPVNHSQRHFNTGIVVVVEHGQTPSAELIDRANGIRRQWIDYWAITTGRRGSMTVDPHLKVSRDLALTPDIRTTGAAIHERPDADQVTDILRARRRRFTAEDCSRGSTGRSG